MLLLAFRNTFRNRRRTIVTLILMIFGSVLFSFFRFFSYGVHQDMILHVVGLTTGYVQIAANGWLENPIIERALDVDDELLSSLRVQGVTQISPRIFGYALISRGENSRFISVLAAEPELEKKITVVHEKIIEGNYFADPDGQYDAIIGYRLARHLGAGIGDEVYLVGSQFDGSVGAVKIRIGGIYRATETTMDNSHIIIRTQAGRELFAPDSPGEGIIRYTSIALAITDYRTAERVHERLLQKYPIPELPPGEEREESSNFDPVALSWEDLNPGVVQMVILDEVQNDFIWAFLVIIVAFGVLNNVQMSIHERLREFGVLLAIGTRPGQIHRMLMYEVLIVLIPSLIIGVAGGMGLGYYFNVNPIEFSGEYGEIYEEFGFVPKFRSIVDAGEIWIAVIGITLPSMLLALLAARRIFKLKPVEIINTI
jgi:ABC-type lipoprotein release transport system permease subunit